MNFVALRPKRVDVPARRPTCVYATGEHVVSGSDDGYITTSAGQSLSVGSHRVSCMSASEAFVIACGKCKVWDFAEGEYVRDFTDGAQLVSTADDLVLATTFLGRMELHDLRQRPWIWESWHNHGKNIQDIAVFSDGTICTVTDTICIWDRRKLRDQLSECDLDTRGIASARISVDGVLVGYNNGELVLWDRMGKLVRAYPESWDAVRNVTMSDKWVVADKGIWDKHSGEKMHNLHADILGMHVCGAQLGVVTKDGCMHEYRIEEMVGEWVD